jgi:hypothetical protein
MAPFGSAPIKLGMKPPPKEPRPGKDEQPPKLSLSGEARRIIEEYASDLRKIIEKLRRHLS